MEECPDSERELGSETAGCRTRGEVDAECATVLAEIVLLRKGKGLDRHDGGRNLRVEAKYAQR